MVLCLMNMDMEAIDFYNKKIDVHVFEKKLPQICLSGDLLRQIYYSVINSKLEYFLFCWISAHLTHFLPMVAAKKKAG